MKNYCFHGYGFSLFLYERHENKNDTIAFASSSWYGNCTNSLTLRGQFQNLSSGQVRSRSGHGQIMTQICQYACHAKQLDEPSRLAPFARLYLHRVVTYWQGMIVTSFDII